ncbi:hypothetical protein LguiA_023911 [Lonicera macranthoides]
MEETLNRAPTVTYKELGVTRAYGTKIRKTRFAYLAITQPWPKVSGFAKVNLSIREVKKHIYGEEKYRDKLLFLPAESKIEDDGYILSFVYDENMWKSELQIVNAMSLELEATIELPSLV